MFEFNPDWKVTIESPNYERATTIPVSIVILLINVLSMLSCIFIMVIFKRDRSLRNIPNFFVFNATIADFMTSLTHASIHLILLSTGNWKQWLCQYSGWTATIFGGSSLSSLGLIALERYCSTVREKPLSQRQASILIFGSWIFSIFLAGFPLMLGQTYLPEQSNVYCIAVWTVEVPAWTTFAVFVFAHITLSISVIGMSYFQIYKTVIAIKSQLHGVNSDNRKKASPSLETSKDGSSNAAANSATLTSSFAKMVNASLNPKALNTTTTPVGTTPEIRPSWWVSMFGGDASANNNASVPVLDKSNSNSASSGNNTSRPRSVSTTNSSRPMLRGTRPMSMIESHTPVPGNGHTVDPSGSVDGQQQPRRKTSIGAGIRQSFKTMRTRANSSNRRLERVLFRKSVIITAVFSLNWSPYLFLVAWQFISGYRLPEWYHIIAAMGVYFNCLTNPILCLFLDTRWLRASKNLLGWKTAESVRSRSSSHNSRTSSFSVSNNNNSSAIKKPVVTDSGGSKLAKNSDVVANRV